MQKSLLGVAMVVVFCITWWIVAGEALQIAQHAEKTAQQAEQAANQAKQAIQPAEQAYEQAEQAVQPAKQELQQVLHNRPYNSMPAKQVEQAYKQLY